MPPTIKRANILSNKRVVAVDNAKDSTKVITTVATNVFIVIEGENRHSLKKNPSLIKNSTIEQHVQPITTNFKSKFIKTRTQAIPIIFLITSAINI